MRGTLLYRNSGNLHTKSVSIDYTLSLQEKRRLAGMFGRAVEPYTSCMRIKTIVATACFVAIDHWVNLAFEFGLSF